MGYWSPGSGFRWTGFRWGSLRWFLKKYLSVIIAIATLAVVVGSLSGYATYIISTAPSNITTEDCLQLSAQLSAELDICKSNLEMLSEFANRTQDKLVVCDLNKLELEEEIKGYKNQIEKLQSDLTACEFDVSTWMAQVDKLTSEINELESELAAAQKKYDSIIANSAKNICCTQKIYKPTLKYYYVESNTIKCTSEANDELGTKEFTCF